MADTLPTTSPQYGAEHVASTHRAGFLAQGAIPIGAAVAQVTSTSADYRHVYLFNHASANRALFGICASTGLAPGLASTSDTSLEEEIEVTMCGYASALLAAGQNIVKGDYLEPFGVAGYWRKAPAGGRGPFQSWQDLDNSGGSTAVLCSGFLSTANNTGRGLVGAVVATSAALSSNAEAAFNQSVVVPIIGTTTAQVAGRVLAIRAKGSYPAGATGDTNIIRLRLGGLTGQILAATPSIDPAANDIWRIDAQVTFRTTTTATVEGSVASGTAGTATLREIGDAALTVDCTVAQTVVCTSDWSADTADTVVLTDLVVEWLN